MHTASSWAKQWRGGLSYLVAVLLLPLALTPAAAGQTALSEKLDAILSAGEFRKADVGVHVVALGSGRVVCSRNAMHRFIAASNEKLVTAATALETLGEDYRFETTLFGRGEVTGGVLQGDLMLRGGGDPTLGGRHDQEDAMTIFRRWAGRMREGGLHGVTGDVVADATFFDRTYRHPAWSRYPIWKWHYTTTAGLSINDNCVRVTVKPGAAAGAAAVLEINPSAAPATLQNLCKTALKQHAIWFDRVAGSSAIKVGGYVRQGSEGYSHEVTIPDPPLYAAAALKQAFEEEGIPIGGRARVLARPNPALYATARRLCARSTALPPVLRTMVSRSHNHYAEQVMKTIGAEADGVGSWEAGCGRAARFLRTLGFKDAEYSLDDGSGLSRRNELTPALLTTLLIRMARSEHAATFRSLLAVAGEEGTLRNRLTEEPYGGNVRAKTGYLSGVGALSGYATTRSGVEVAFSILINDSENPPGTYSMRKKLDAICRAIVDHAQ